VLELVLWVILYTSIVAFVNNCNKEGYLRIRATRWRECVYVLQSVFFLSATAKCINMRQPFSGMAERIFLKLLPNDRGEM